MSISQAMCTSFKRELLTATHNFFFFFDDAFKLALYKSSSSLDASTTAYVTSNELA